MRLLFKSVPVILLAGSGLCQSKDAITKLAGQVDATRYGCLADGSSDNTNCINNALAAISAAGGGALWFCGPLPFRVNGQIVVPNDGVSTPTYKQVSLRITGCGSNGGYKSPNGTSGGILDLRYNGSGAQIETLGSGYLEVDHIGLKNGGTGGGNSTPFFLTTNTTVNIHDISIIGDTSLNGVTNIQDAILLGGGGDSPTNTDTSSFSGYGSYITNVWVDHIRRFLYFWSGPSWTVNGVQVTNNVVWVECGSNDLANGAAIELSSAGQNFGNYFAGNLFEGTYKWFVRVARGGKNAFIFNTVFDNTDTAIYRFEEAQYNFVLHAYTNVNQSAVMSEQSVGQNTLLSGDPSAVSHWINPLLMYAGSVRLNPTAFASLPTCNAAAIGTPVYCSDCKNVADDTTGTFDSVAANGGHGTTVLCENSAWRVH